MRYARCMRATDPKVLVKVEWTCWLSSESRDLTRWECRDLLALFEVRIPAGERDQLPVREAMELFIMLAAVNNTVFKKLVAQYMDHSRFADHPHVVFPRWLCELVGEVPSDDPVTTQGSVTWGEIFGFSQGPREYSLGFRNAMEKLKAMGLEGSRYLCASARWEVKSNLFFRTIETSGKQHVAFPPRKSQVPTVEEFSRHFGRFFSFTAPPAAQLCAVDDADKMTEAWKRQPQQLPDESVVNTVDRMCSSFMDLELRGRLNVHQVLAALVRSGLTHQTLQLASASRQIGFEAMLNFGFLIAVLLRQNPLCAPSRGDHSFSFRENDHCRDLEVLFNCSLDIRMTGICSAVAGSPRIEKLSIGRWINRNYPGVERMRHCYWGWLGFALSNDSIQQLKITGVDLGLRGVVLFEAALKHKYPEPVLSTLSSPQYGYIKVRAGTMLNSRDWGDADRTSFALLRDCRCRALFDPFTMKSEVNVVVPGHGICSLKLTDQASGFVPDRVAKSSTPSESSSRLQSLKLNIATCQSGAALTNLLKLVGSNLHSLSIAVLEPNQVVSVDMAALAGSCTKLEDLCLDQTSVSASVFNEAVCDWGLREIVLRYSEPPSDLSFWLRCLNGCTRMSRELVQLTILFTKPGGLTSSVQATVNELEAHDGKFLPVVKNKFPIHLKAAMISVVYGNDNKRSCGYLRPIRRLKEDNMALIFQFASTPEQRSVRVHLPQ